MAEIDIQELVDSLDEHSLEEYKELKSQQKEINSKIKDLLNEQFCSLQRKSSLSYKSVYWIYSPDEVEEIEIDGIKYWLNEDDEIIEKKTGNYMGKKTKDGNFEIDEWNL